MAATLTWSWNEKRVRIVGRIDENADLGTLAGEIPTTGATLDLGGLTRINSIGVREWMDFVAVLRDRPIVLERCAPVFVDQLNAIANFSGAARIDSVLTAFECEADGELQYVEASLPDLRAGTMPVSPRCLLCGRETISAQENEVYFRFIRYMR